MVMIEISENKLEKMGRLVEEMLRTGGDLMLCLDEMRRNSEGGGYGQREGMEEMWRYEDQEGYGQRGEYEGGYGMRGGYGERGGGSGGSGGGGYGQRGSGGSGGYGGSSGYGERRGVRGTGPYSRYR